MKYNYICIIGNIPFGLFGVIWKSKIMIYMCILGILFHMNYNNKYLNVHLCRRRGCMHNVQINREHIAEKGCHTTLQAQVLLRMRLEEHGD